jgi:hypothetical protein
LVNDTHAPRQTLQELLKALHDKFGANLDSSFDDSTIPLLNTIDLNSRVISEFKILLQQNSSEKHRLGCAEILDEVFSDFAISMYLHSVGLIVPARMSIRRAFELSLATVYMWDMPQEFWGWRKCDQDLSFSTMVTHLNSSGYNEYIAQMKGESKTVTFCDQVKFQKLYRILSNTVHGKSADLPALAPERFSTISNGILEHLELILKTQEEVINLLFGRFYDFAKDIYEIFPQIKRH